MAKAQIQFPTEVLDKLSALSTDEKLVSTTLKAGAHVVFPKVKGNLLSSIGKNTKRPSQSTGQLASALGISKVRVNRKGNFDIKIGFLENRSDRRKNALIANVLEYGKSNQVARPFLRLAARSTKRQAIDEMKHVLTCEIERHLK